MQNQFTCTYKLLLTLGYVNILSLNCMMQKQCLMKYKVVCDNALNVMQEN